MPNAIRVHQHGGADNMRWEAVDVGKPAAGEVRIRQTFAGLNFIDVYHRSGLYTLPMPTGIGLEACGVVEEVGAGVVDVKAGDRVAYGTGPIGSYADVRVMPAEKLVKVPAGISDQQAAGMMLKGLTAHYLIRRTYAVKAGETILVHAAAGGVGLILCQWAKHLGATVIGTVGNEDKASLAKAHGCHHTILYGREDFVARVNEITGGKKVPVVYDGVGKDTFMKSLDCLAPRGMMVAFGNASGPVTGLDVGILATKGSLFLTRPTLGNYAGSRSDLVANAAELFDVVGKGAVKIEVNQTYPLKEAVQAHKDLESRKTTGVTVLAV